MNTFDKNNIKTDDIPLAAVKKKTEFSLVWVIPIVAIIIAGGLVYKAITEKGPVITISFKSADGLEAGNTKIKYKDVEIGIVETIVVSEDLKGVIVTAQMIQEAKHYLKDQTRFWIVRPRLSAGNVSGLGTLLSGSYIAIDIGQDGKPKKSYTGLEIPPVIMSDQPGQKVQLNAPELSSLEQGSPVYYRGITVGQVMKYELSKSGESIDIQVFIESPYDKNILDTTRFWFASGLDVYLDAKGLRIDTQSLISFLIGGLVFTNPDHIKPGLPIKAETILPVYNSYTDAMEIQYTQTDYYLLKFNHSVRGLSIGAPVEFRGFVIGRVVEIGLEADWKNNQLNVSVKILVEPGRIIKHAKNRDDPRNNLENLIKMGMRAQLQTGNIISGSQFIALDFFDGVEPAFLVVHDDIIELPTIPSSLNRLSSSLTSLLNKLEKLPIEQIGDTTSKAIQNINETMDSYKDVANSITGLVASDDIINTLDNFNKSMVSIRNLMAKLEHNLPSQLESVSETATDALSGIQKITASDSDLIFELKQTLREFTKTADSIRTLADQLERHPESIFQGKGTQ